MEEVSKNNIEEVLKNYRKLAEKFKDEGSFYANLDISFLAYKDNKDKIDYVEYIAKESESYIKYVKDFIWGIQIEAKFPPFHRALPLVFIAMTNLQWVLNQAKSFLKNCRESKQVKVELAQEAYNRVISYYGSIFDEIPKDIKVLDKKSNFEWKEVTEIANSEANLFLVDADFISLITIPFLQKLISEMEDNYETLNFFYGRFLGNALEDFAKGEEAVYNLGNALFHIKHEEDILALMNIDNIGVLPNNTPLKKYLPSESILTPEQLGALFYLMREENLITNTRDREISWYISLMTGISHHTIYNKGLRQMVFRNYTPTVLQEVNYKGDFVNAPKLKESLLKIIKKIDQAVEEYKRDYT